MRSMLAGIAAFCLAAGTGAASAQNSHPEELDDSHEIFTNIGVHER